MIVQGKEINISKLINELNNAGISINGLGGDVDTLFTYNEIGEPVALPGTALEIISAHNPILNVPSIEDRVSAIEEVLLMIL